jgi:hypothetical protein
MDALDRYLNRIAYKFNKGYPDVNNPKDMEMLFEMINEIISEEQLKLFDDEVLDQMKIDLKITDDDFDTEKELRSILNKADSRVKEKYKLDDPEMFEKIVNGIMNARLQPELLDLLKKKGYNKIILDRYATELSSVFNSVADKDRDKFIKYITSPNQKSFSKSPVGNIKGEIKATGMDFEDDAVFDSLIKFTTQDEKKLGVGMGELALAMLFKNIGAAQNKGDLTLDNEEFEIKGYNAKLGRDPSAYKINADDVVKLGIKRVDSKRGDKNVTQMFVGDREFKLNRFSDMLEKLYEKAEDKNQFKQDLFNLLTAKPGPSLPDDAVKYRLDQTDFTNADNIQKNIALINFIRYAKEENFPHFLVHDMGQSSGPGTGEYVYVSGTPEEMSDQLFDSPAYFQDIGLNNVNPRIRL